MARPEPGEARGRTVRSLATRRKVERRWFAPAIAFACTWHADPASAERWSLEPALESRATWTDNAAFDQSGQKQSDTLIELIPSLNLRGEGKRLRILGKVGADVLTYVNGTRDQRVLPHVDLTANLEAIE